MELKETKIESRVFAVASYLPPGMPFLWLLTLGFYSLRKFLTGKAGDNFAVYHGWQAFCLFVLCYVFIFIGLLITRNAMWSILIAYGIVIILSIIGIIYSLKGIYLTLPVIYRLARRGRV